MSVGIINFCIRSVIANLNRRQRERLAAVLAFIMSSQELKPNKITDDEIKTNAE